MATQTKRAAIYMRVRSTSDQTTANQLQELERVAAFRGWTVVKIYKDEGIKRCGGS